MDELLQVGIITQTHGIRGEVKVFPTTDDVKRFKKCDEVILVTREGNLTLHVEGAKFFKNIVILKFKEFNDIIGADVVEEEGAHIGKVTDVIETGANNVFVIRTDEGKEVLFPVIPDCIKKVDTEAGVVTAHIMKGLME